MGRIYKSREDFIRDHALENVFHKVTDLLRKHISNSISTLVDKHIFDTASDFMKIPTIYLVEISLVDYTP